jgi:hypothetical protein
VHIGYTRNKAQTEPMQDELDPTLKDFYSTFDPLAVSTLDEQDYQRYLATLSEEEKALLNDGRNYYELTFKNKGGLVMPIILQFQYEDGTTEDHYIPAEIWRKNSEQVSKVFTTQKAIQQIVLDPYLETADTDRSDNYFPAKQEMNRFELFKRGTRGGGENPMQRAKRAGN